MILSAAARRLSGAVFKAGLVSSLLLSTLLPAPLWAAVSADRLRADAPGHYEVKKGDTLWHISARFLQDPWLWPQLWRENPQVENPDLIYPGDRLTLLFDDAGQPHLQLERSGVVKLSPGVRITRYRQAVPAIPLEQIEPFIARHQVYSEQQIADSGYILGAEDQRIVTGSGDRVYVRGAARASDGSRFLVYRPQRQYRDTDLNGKPVLIGTEMKYIGTLEQESVQQQRSTEQPDSAPVAVMRVVQAREELRHNDLVVPQTVADSPATFYPSAPSRRVQGEIISVLDGVKFTGHNAVVAINLGTANRLVPGNVLTIRQQRMPVKDSRSGEWVELPTEETGKLMVFRTFKQVSYALVMQADKPIGVGDQLHSPR